MENTKNSPAYAQGFGRCFVKRLLLVLPLILIGNEMSAMLANGLRKGVQLTRPALARSNSTMLKVEDAICDATMPTVGTLIIAGASGAVLSPFLCLHDKIKDGSVSAQSKFVGQIGLSTFATGFIGLCNTFAEIPLPGGVYARPTIARCAVLASPLLVMAGMGGYLGYKCIANYQANKAQEKIAKK
jgi:hypothetical protein